MNALKHGLTAETVAIAAERAEDFAAFSEAVFEDINPVGALEGLLVERIVISSWRLKRAVRREARLRPEGGAVSLQNLIRESYLKSDVGTGAQTDPPDNRQPVPSECDSLSPDHLNLLKYETTHERSLYRAIHTLERLQARRRGQHVMAPIAIDVDTNPGAPKPR